MNPVDRNQLREMIEGPLPWPLEIDTERASSLRRRMQTSVVNAMADLKQWRICYPKQLKELHPVEISHLESTPIAALPKIFFETTASNTLRLRKEAAPSRAIHELLDPYSAVIGVDCLVATHIALTSALMQELGDESFDMLFQANADYCLTFEPQKLYRPLYHLQTVETRVKPSELQQGDLVHFHGVESYRKKYPQGDWGGLNAICVETGKDPRFDAHGLEEPRTASEICRLLEEAMEEPSIPHKAKGWNGTAMRLDFFKIFYLKQQLQSLQNLSE